MWLRCFSCLSVTAFVFAFFYYYYFCCYCCCVVVVVVIIIIVIVFNIQTVKMFLIILLLFSSFHILDSFGLVVVGWVGSLFVCAANG